MNSLPLTRLSLIEIKACESHPIPPSLWSDQNHLLSTLLLYSAQSWRTVSIPVSSASEKCKLQQLSGLFKEKKAQKSFCLSDLGNCFNFHISSPSSAVTGIVV